ncbi:MAG: hypothetical protein M1820_002436 [Bogoriella megaspora]|nr:MAG: hypothetical protein M1820_002436 [Bogoriella megaspora]
MFSSIPLVAASLFWLAGRAVSEDSLKPVVVKDFPDPSLIQVDNTWYSFATCGNGYKTQIATSEDFSTWSLMQHHDALPAVGAWVSKDKGMGFPVAPDVQRMADGSFVLYYSAVSKDAPAHKHTKCVGAATSHNVTGPYKPVDTPFACDNNRGGIIDASGFHDPDSNQQYVLYKVDGNSLGSGGECLNMVKPIRSTPIMLQKTAPDGVTHQGDPVQILDRDDSDGPLVEAPYLHKYGKKYVLFYSNGCFSAHDYTVSYAVADSIEGPYVKASKPLFAAGKLGLDGPGGASVSEDGSKIVFHGHWGSGGKHQPRALFAQNIKFDGEKVTNSGGGEAAKPSLPSTIIPHPSKVESLKSEHKVLQTDKPASITAPMSQLAETTTRKTDSSTTLSASTLSKASQNSASTGSTSSRQLSSTADSDSKHETSSKIPTSTSHMASPESTSSSNVTSAIHSSTIEAPKSSAASSNTTAVRSPETPSNTTSGVAVPLSPASTSPLLSSAVVSLSSSVHSSKTSSKPSTSPAQSSIPAVHTSSETQSATSSEKPSTSPASSSSAAAHTSSEARSTMSSEKPGANETITSSGHTSNSHTSSSHASSSSVHPKSSLAASTSSESGKPSSIRTYTSTTSTKHGSSSSSPSPSTSTSPSTPQIQPSQIYNGSGDKPTSVASQIYPGTGGKASGSPPSSTPAPAPTGFSPESKPSQIYPGTGDKADTPSGRHSVTPFKGDGTAGASLGIVWGKLVGALVTSVLLGSLRIL